MKSSETARLQKLEAAELQAAINEEPLMTAKLIGLGVDLEKKFINEQDCYSGIQSKNELKVIS